MGERLWLDPKCGLVNLAEVALVRREEPLDQVVGRVVVMTIEQKPNERVAVGVGLSLAMPSSTSRSEIIRASHSASVYGSNDCPGDIDRTFGVHARHLGGLAAEQRATDLLARLGHPDDDLHDFGDGLAVAM